MWPKVDFGNFYRFIASIGLVCLVAAGVVPLLIAVQGQSFDLQTAEVELLQEESRVLYLNRLAVFSTYLLWAPAISLTLLALGIACSWWGLAGWYRRQRNTDRREDAETKVAEASVRQASPEERESHLREDAIEALGQVQDEPSLPQPSVPPEPPEPPENPASRIEHPPDTETEDGGFMGVDRETAIRGIAEKMRAVDGEVMKLLAEATRGSHRLLQQVKLGESPNRYLIDALLLPEGVGQDVAPMMVEVSYVPTKASFRARALKVGRVLSGAATGIKWAESRWPILLGLLVLDYRMGDHELESSIDEARRLLDSAGMSSVNLLAIHEDELHGLDVDSFRELLRSGVRGAQWGRLRLQHAERTASRPAIV